MFVEKLKSPNLMSKMKKDYKATLRIISWSSPQNSFTVIWNQNEQKYWKKLKVQFLERSVVAIFKFNEFSITTLKETF